MAYARPPLDGRNPPDMGPERSRPYWEPQYHHPYVQMPERPPQHHHHLSNSNMVGVDPMDPESSDSDVSVLGGDKYQYSSPPTAPASLPPQPPKHVLESSDAVQARLRELSRVEDNNIKKHELLTAKRRRKDEKIGRKRDFQDRKWRSIMDARARRDTRVVARREREDAAFKRFDEQLEEEEMNLHRRLKRLKRGLPIDESPQIGARSLSSTSMSPPGPTFSTIPPPAKRHQTGPPGHPDSINQGSFPSQSPSLLPPPPPPPLPPPPPQHHAGHPTPPQNGPPAPQYSFYQSNTPSYNVPYHPPQHHPPPPPPSRQYGPPPNQSPPAPPKGPPRLDHYPNDRSNYNMNGQPPSPVSRPGPPTAPHHNSPNSANGPPRGTTSTYDTRPPPSTTSSGFASINMPQGSGFASINAKGPPPPSYVKSESDPSRTPGGGPMMDYGVNNHSRMYNYGGTPTTTPNPMPATGKRTPSTTHPYQMSEAFANRHHHCERVDGLNRGIWTSHGPMGTLDAPTGPPTEMYLRCDHDNCRRIDWRTVHGLQCHIVKNHDQPKGTIGSLEKALDKYGVPVKEVEEYEREHGEGTAGTMADPKNLKIKNKTKEAAIGRGNWKRNSPSPYGYDPSARPAGFKPEQISTLDSPSIIPSTGRSPTSSVAAASGYMQDDIVTSDDEDDYHKSRPNTNRKSTTQHETGKRDRESPVNHAAPSREKLRTELIPSDSNQRVSGMYIAAMTEEIDRPEARAGLAPEEKSSRIHDQNNPSLLDQASRTLNTAIVDANQSQKEEHAHERKQEFPALEVQQEREKDTTMTGTAEEPRKGQDQEIEATVEDEAHKKKTDDLVNGDNVPIQETSKTVNQEEKGEKAEAQPTEEVVVPALPPPPAPSTSRRSTLQSPIMTNKIPSTPTSAKRGSRRSSTARKMSVDGVEVDMMPSTTMDKETKDKQVEVDGDRDIVTVSTGTKTPPRRLPNGRLLRNGR